ncbi:hypothetical protein DFH08DRAFT_861195 [Mycena albidolilacea]|uniref:Uncharacterized protein n=1 Tax=Mycena albidolilacea TaxID=1033008 RepID=A0AAD7EVA2_9AGAR|nr:hypothetical protein DFH08DRAFT_861195 [Mycena albidolilacea]
MIIARIILAAAFILSLTNSANSLILPSLVPRELTAPTTNAAMFSVSRILHSPLLLLSAARGTSSSPAKSITIAASVAIGAFAALIAVIFVVFYKRLGQKRIYYNVEVPRRQPPVLRIGTNFPAEMKAAYLDSPRPRRSSIIAEPLGPLARDPLLSPLAASQQPGFIPRPIPANVPVSVPVSRVPSMRSVPRSRAASVQLGNAQSHYSGVPSSALHSRAASAQFSTAHSHRSSGVPPEELAELLDELSRHYVLKDQVQRDRHRPSASLTGRPRVFRAYSDGI